MTHTPGPWTTKVICCSVSLERTGYAHQVVIGNCEHTVAHTDHENWEYIHREQLPDGYVRETGIGRREPDITPHPDACLAAAAPTLLEACEAALPYLADHIAMTLDAGPGDRIAYDKVEAAIALARGRT